VSHTKDNHQLEMAQEQTVDELLEQAEKNANQADAAKKRGSDSESASDFRKSRDPRLTGRNDRDRYSDEREGNDEARAHQRGRNGSLDLAIRSSSDRGSANGSVTGRRRTRSRSPRRDSRNRGQQRRDHRGDDIYRPEHDGRSRRERSPNGRDRDRDRNRDRDRDRSSRYNGHNGHGGPRDRAYDGGNRRHSPGRPRKPRTPEPTDDERDRRTVFVQQLAARLRTKELQKFFEQVGPVVEAQIVKDRVSGRSKG